MKMIGIILAVVILVALVAIVMNASKKKAVTEVTPQDVVTEDTTAPVTEETTAPVPVPVNVAIPKDAHVDVVGANPVTKDNIVITSTGEVAKNDVVPMSPQAPQQTAPISVAQLPKSAVKVSVSAAGFSPSEFTVKAGAAVTFSVSSTDGLTHVFMFDDASLGAVAIGVGPSETRAITFNAPSKAGDYTFRCDVPGHSGRGEKGKMIVK